MPKLSVASRERLRKIKVPTFLWRGLGLGVLTSINGLMSTLNYRMVRYDPAADPADASFISPAIFVFWHEYIFFPIYLRPHCRLAMLLSQHQDAEILSHVAHFAGLETVRGSTHRGGTAALKEMLHRAQGMSLAITPDGPRGPRRQLAQGCVYLSSRLQVPIVPIGFGCDRPWRNRSSWDQFAIPRPYSRARAVVGPRIQVPAELEREDIEKHRQWLEQQLNMLTDTAEDWAEKRCHPAAAELLARSSPVIH
ncbi:MAG: lysophospholipid acyltransferase family protein [Pirellulaceae bacterium]